MKKTNSIYYLTVVALALLLGGIYFIKTNENPQGLQQVLPYICFGLGCSFFSHGIGEILIRLVMKNNAVAAKQIEINKKDERNLPIANQAKAKAYDMMVIVFGALILAFSLMDLDFKKLLLLVIAYLFFLGYNSYYRLKFYKEM
ncbi:hypothetical protein [Bacillus sp. AFS053548]|uniref:hypothetical protein n=1 Tax=Bacillus sp. AFS053548 TaxID=2033505 RepID=UPI000BFB79F2|nr:hypothetical protein [Bacillus sp. AFS053548]PGM56159.1 hypothetical protein CN946_11535 [Bacillus sp. AFS053548]